MNESKEIKNTKEKPNLPFHYKLLRTILQSLLIFCFLLMCLYIVGNFQDFQDKSQEILLEVLSYTSIFTSLLTIPLIIENIIMLFTDKKKLYHVFSLIMMIFTVLFCFLCLGISHFIVFLADGL